ncbi:MAG: type II toxin-antitoxin system prevent-host-death family antitoxin [Micrococcales bacterium]|nr:type II toxin-antitoxin system prevent-host-death family antitoxin [Micrococcales bacterium]
MKTVTFSHARANLAATFDAVVNDAEETIVTRAGHEPVVLISLDEYSSMRETAYLMRSPANARRLLESIAELEAGAGTPRELVEVNG